MLNEYKLSRSTYRSAFLVVGICFIFLTMGFASATLISRYNMNTNSGTTIYDSYSPDQDGTFGSPAPDWFSSGGRTGLEFAGGSQFYAGEYVYVDDDGDYEFENDNYFDIHAKIWLDEDAYHYNMICAKYEYDSGDGYGYQLRIDNGKARFTIYDGDTSPKNVYTSITVPDETWIIVTCCYRPAQNYIEVYYKYEGYPYTTYGRQLTTIGSGDYIEYHNSMPDFTIGRNSDSWGGYQPFMGKMDVIDIND